MPHRSVPERYRFYSTQEGAQRRPTQISSPVKADRKGNRRTSATALAALALAAFALLVAPAAAKPPPQPILWGAQIGPQLTGEPAPWDMNAVTAFQQITGKAPSLISFSAPFADCDSGECVFNNFPTTPMEDVRAYGAVPMFNWGSEGGSATSDEPAFRLKRVAAGAYDEYITQFATAAREWGHPFFLRFNWEMNGFWFPWGVQTNHNSPQSFVAAWRRVHDIFSSVGASNATWVWCPNVDFTRKLASLHSVYPGGRYVDWTCLDGFNWGKTKNSIGWQSFDQVFHTTYKRIQKIAAHKPMMIGEVASDDRGGSKAKWIKHMLAVIPQKYRKIRGLVWYEEHDQGMHWSLTSSKSAGNAFRRGISRTVYQSNSFGNLTGAPIGAPVW